VSVIFFNIPDAIFERLSLPEKMQAQKSVS